MIGAVIKTLRIYLGGNIASVIVGSPTLNMT